MSRLSRILGLAMIVSCTLTLYSSLERSGRSVSVDPSDSLRALRSSLTDAGLRSRDDVLIEINGRDVALGFSLPGCDGLLLVAVLPNTAQSWAHMAPRLDWSPFHLGYFYNGALYPGVPRLERLAGRLLGDLRPHHAGAFPQVVAMAEAGHCRLAPAAAPALEAVSRGWPPSAGRPELTWLRGDDSA